MDSSLVYSTETGRMCPSCGKPSAQCVCKKKRGSSKQKQMSSTRQSPSSKNSVPDGIVRVGRETKGRKGKGVTVISGLKLSEADLKELARTLKQKCGSGGAVKNGVIEIQGDHRDELVEQLKNSGYSVKRSGG